MSQLRTLHFTCPKLLAVDRRFGLHHSRLSETDRIELAERSLQLAQREGAKARLGPAGLMEELAGHTSDVTQLGPGASMPPARFCTCGVELVLADEL